MPPTAAAAAKLVGCPAKQVFIASTGVIGEVLPHEKLVAALPALHAGLRDDGWEAAARGIMTTDTFPKAATRTATIGEAEVRISGIRQGQRHDRARHGDDAVLRVHRREAAGRRDAGAAEEGASTPASTARRWIRIPPPRTPCCCSPPARRSIRGCRRKAGAMLADFARALDAVLLDLALAGGAGRGGGAEAGARRCHRRHHARDRRSALGWRWRTRRW